MEENLFQLAKDYVTANKAKIIEMVIDDCCWDEYGEPSEDLAAQYERILYAMAQQEGEKEAAAAYMYIAVASELEDIFIKERGLQLLLQMNAYETYCDLIKKYDDIYDRDYYQWIQRKPLLMASELALMAGNADE